MTRGVHLWLGAAVAAALLPAEALGVRLVGRVVRVGFQGSGRDLNTRGSDFYRAGHWTPVLVELDNQDGDSFQGTVEVRQSDRDGDEVVAAQAVDVRGLKRVYLYVPAGSDDYVAAVGPGPFAVRVLDAGGKLARLYDDQNQQVTALQPPRPVLAIPAESRVILDISARPVAPLNGAELLADPGLLRELIVARVGPAEVPDQPEGLDVADVIVWDGADPGSDFRDPLVQMTSLLEWTKRGGTLVVGVSKNWELVSKSRLGPLLPAQLRGSASTSRIPAGLGEILYGDAGVAASFDPPLHYCPVTTEVLAPGAQTLVPAEATAKDLLFVTRRPCDHGWIVMVSAEILELLQHGTPSANVAFLRQVLGVRKRSSEKSPQAWAQTDLFQRIEGVTSFGTTAGIYFLFAFAFVIAYIATATGGSWVWLRRRGMIQQSWTAFGAMSVAASVLSLVAVQWIRGIGHKVEEMTVVDAQAGSYEATASMYLGLKTASHTRMDLAVPREWVNAADGEEPAGTIRPLPAGSLDRAQIVYSVGQRYEAAPALGQLRAVPLRATLKQFEATWQGAMKGRLNASLRRAGSTSAELSDDSWIENALGTDLDDCYLFVASPTTRWPEGASRRLSIHVYPMGKLPAGSRITVGQLIAAQTEELRAQARRDRTLAPEDPDGAELQWRPETNLLGKQQGLWLDKLGVSADYYRATREEQLLSFDPGRFASALLLLSLYDEIDFQELESSRWSIERSQGQRLDGSALVTRDVALLAGFSQDPGPARLCWRRPGATGGWKPIHPSRAHVMYRVSIPVGR